MRCLTLIEVGVNIWQAWPILTYPPARSSLSLIVTHLYLVSHDHMSINVLPFGDCRFDKRNHIFYPTLGRNLEVSQFVACVIGVYQRTLKFCVNSGIALCEGYKEVFGVVQAACHYIFV
ncbi:hypothetical protein Bhyg_01448 [Pseudolycoriella hygida]|uniref:Uncharacterized protein n=1 Tax=Pseudolycoriella hygida TaxID=35572 RepID=A0A9Q0S5K1_9DIPT|nr:hypothetical protein Bhyg_01448 [Pseudolycoriella hygida]